MFEPMRAAVCERMGWTFAEFDRTPARDIIVLLEIWRVQEELKPKPKKRR
jgi:hypothetical protein